MSEKILGFLAEIWEETRFLTQEQTANESNYLLPITYYLLPTYN
ncbi:hypothetical protein [Microseira sp. BLCC-F43]